MLWLARKVPVCVYESSPKGPFQSNTRLIFLGRLLVSPLLFFGATGYHVYLADQQRLRSIVLSELTHIMSAAYLDSTYHIQDWFMKKGRLFVYVAEKSPTIKRGLRPHSKKTLTWLRRVLSRSR